MDRSESIDAIRRFNRMYVAFMHLLDAAYVDTGRPLVDTRVLFEIAERPGVTARQVADASDAQLADLATHMRALEEMLAALAG